MKPTLKKKAEPEAKPGVIVGDDLYVHHKGQPCTGRVAAHGKHGVTVAIKGEHHQVPWDKVLGHKKRAIQKYSVVDQGEDGMIVADKRGLRQFVATPNEAKDDPMVAKAQRAVLLFAKAGMPGGPGLQKKQLTDKNGVQTTRWVSVDRGGPPAQRGQHVGFHNGEHKSHGEVLGSGSKGVKVRDMAGGVHRVPHEKVTHHFEGEGAPDTSPHDGKKLVRPHDGPPETFSAAAFAEQHDDKEATPDSIVEHFGGDARGRIDSARARLAGITSTHEQHQQDGKWSPERAELHRKILFDGIEVKGKKVPGVLAAERIKAATPAPGEKPVFIALGGRGGSGKSSLNGRVYDETKALVLDADHIKGLLPEYEGWNAHQVHEESSVIIGAVLELAQQLGLNVVYDATMKSGKTIEKLVDRFNEGGYRTEAHYMHLPRQEATKRAVGRFLNGGERGRFVPPEVVMGNTDNERNFDAIKDKVHAWSFHDNSGSKDAGPKLIAKNGDASMVKGSGALLKSEQSPIIVLWKRSPS